jgi:hypothetical protein
MTTKELINSLSAQGWDVRKDGGNIICSKDTMTISMTEKAVPESSLDGITLAEWWNFYTTLMEYANTPLDDRKPKTEYRVRLRGFNSDNGYQYLTAKSNGMKTTKIFACALNPSLKQEFTLDEIYAIANRNEFKAVPWIQELLRNAEEVTNDEEPN